MTSNLGISYAVVNIIPVKHVLSADDVTKGIEYCLSNDEFDVKVSVYVFLNQSLATSMEAENKIIDKLCSLKIYRCNLDVVYMAQNALSLAKGEYTDTYDLDSRLENDARVCEYRRYSISRNSGNQLTKIVKRDS